MADGGRVPPGAIGDWPPQPAAASIAARREIDNVFTVMFDRRAAVKVALCRLDSGVGRLFIRSCLLAQTRGQADSYNLSW